MIIADTDVLIDFLSGHEPSASHVSDEIERANLRTTVISRFELLSGAHSEEQQERIQDLLGSVQPLIVDSAAADAAANMRRHLETSGRPIGMADCLIAGIARAVGAPLLTRNTRHFSRIEGLELIEPG